MKNSIKLMLGLGDTRSNHEDFAITPYLAGIYVNQYPDYQVYGLSLTWGWWSIAICAGYGTGVKQELYHVITVDRFANEKGFNLF